MDKDNNIHFDMPDWLTKKEQYIPQSDKDTFVNKSILSLLMVISKIKTQDSSYIVKYQVNATLKVALTFMLLILLSVSRNFHFVIIIDVYLLVILSIMKADDIVKILKVSLVMTIFTFVIMLPAFIQGNSYSSIMITSKVFSTITAIGILTHSTKWSSITSSLKRFLVPDLFILVLDITIKYIVMLGDFTLNMLYSLKLRSVGKNRSKYTSLSGIAGTMFLKSKEMAEEMYYAMECRGFTGEYNVCDRSGFTVADVFYLILNLGILLVFICFWLE